MIYVHHSNFAEVHQALIANMMRDQPLLDPLAEEVVLVQSPGMAQWLKLSLAEELGISANIRFPLPSSFIWELFTRVLPDLPKESAFNKEPMGWKIMHLLPQFLQQPEFAPLKAYLSDDEGQRKRYQLAMKIADIFDQYLVYRPQWISAWECNETGSAPVELQPWQPILWRALVEYNALVGGHPAHRVNLYEQFCQRLSEEKAQLPLPQRVFVFGVSALAPQYLNALTELGRHLDLHILQLNPCRYYWGDLLDERTISWMNRQSLSKNGRMPAEYQGETNPLLASFGKLGRDYQEQLHELDQQLQIAVNHREHFVDYPAVTLLDSIQSDLLNLENRGQLPAGQPLPDNSCHKTELAEDDSSLELHLCHSPMREVEVLYEQLLTLFSDNSSLNPRDVLVMLPAVDQYSAYIQAVFGNAVGERKIPWSIADRGVQQENPLLISFFQLLQLPTSRFEVTRILDVLEVPEVMQRFELHQDEFDQLREWIRASGIRWGLDDEQLATAGLYPQQQNSWQFGLQRMLLGLALPQQQGAFGGILPFDEVEGLGAQKLGKLIDFVESLRHYQQRFSSAATADEWLDRCNALLEAFYDPGLQAEHSFSLIRQTLDRLQQQLKDAHYDEPVTPEVFVEYLQSNLSDSNSSQRFLAGQVNFCTLMPMRSIPFKVVCLLGMNDGAYPRSMPPLGFDLMAEKPLLGDRSRRDDDRYLFLEALLSARQKLYISYVGRSIRDNSERIPSVLVTELIEYCQQGFVAKGDMDYPCQQSSERLLDRLSIEHSLQPFSVANFEHDSGGPTSHDTGWLKVAQSLSQRQYHQQNAATTTFCADPLLPGELNEEVAAGTQIVELTQLIRFFDNAPKYFLQQRLRVYFNELHAQEEDDEPFAEDMLLRHQECTDLVRLQLQGVSTEQWEQKLRLSGTVPVGHFGEQMLAGWRLKVAGLVTSVGPFVEGDSQSVDVDITLDTTTLRGRIDDVFPGQGLLIWRVGSCKARDYVRLWIRHLALSASGVACCSQLVDESNRIGFAPLASADQARQHLQTLVEIYLRGQQQPVPLPIESAHAWAEAQINDKDPDEAWDLVAKKWQSGFVRGEDADPYLARVYPSMDALRQTDFTELAWQLFEPLLGAIHKEKL